MTDEDIFGPKVRMSPLRRLLWYIRFFIFPLTPAWILYVIIGAGEYETALNSKNARSYGSCPQAGDSPLKHMQWWILKVMDVFYIMSHNTPRHGPRIIQIYNKIIQVFGFRFHPHGCMLLYYGLDGKPNLGHYRFCLEQINEKKEVLNTYRICKECINSDVAKPLYFYENCLHCCEECGSFDKSKVMNCIV